MQALRARRKDDRGFTLIELLVVLLIIGILISIAIPSFFGARKTAQNTAAKATLRNALTAAKVYYVNNNGSYTGFATSGDSPCGNGISVAVCIEPSLPWTAAPGPITVVSASANTIKLEMTSASTQVCTLEDTGSAITITGCD